MKGMQWLVGAAALVAFDASLIWGVRYWQAHDVPALEAPMVAAVPPDVSLPVSGLPVPRSIPTACMAGVTWVYDVDADRWLKLEPVLKCDVGDVRKVLRRDGVTRGYPKPCNPVISIILHNRHLHQ